MSPRFRRQLSLCRAFGASLSPKPMRMASGRSWVFSSSQLFCPPAGPAPPSSRAVSNAAGLALCCFDASDSNSTLSSPRVSPAWTSELSAATRRLVLTAVSSRLTGAEPDRRNFHSRSFSIRCAHARRAWTACTTRVLSTVQHARARRYTPACTARTREARRYQHACRW